MSTDSRFCVSCQAPIPPESEVCAKCGAYQYASPVKRPLPHLQYNEPFQPPNGMRADVSLQVAPGQYVLIMPQAIAVMPLARRRISGFAITSMVIGIPATILALLVMIFEVHTALDPLTAPIPLAINSMLALFCWTPALIAFIFGLLAQRKIWRSNGQIHGLGLAYTGVTLGSISFALALIGVILSSLALLP